MAAAVQKAVFNARTQPAALGWSRHGRFGEHPCLAGLYYRDRSRRKIATALGADALRVLGYLTDRLPVGSRSHESSRSTT